MKARKILSVVSACAMAMMVLAPSISAEEPVSDTRDITVKYDFTSTLEPKAPYYAVSIPAGIVFDAKSPTSIVEVNIDMIPAQGEDKIYDGSSATVSVQSENGSFVELKEVTSGTGTDQVKYKLNYENKTLDGKKELNIGTLNFVREGDSNNKTTINGTARLDGVATKTGNHIDKLTHTVTDASGAGA